MNSTVITIEVLDEEGDSFEGETCDECSNEKCIFEIFVREVSDTYENEKYFHACSSRHMHQIIEEFIHVT